MPTHLRIHRDDDPTDPQSVPANDVPEVLPFPLKTARERLVAGTVPHDARHFAPSHGQERQFFPETALPRIEDRHTHSSPIKFPRGKNARGSGVHEVTPTDDLIRQIEQTIDRMQDRLHEFRDQLDESFKFPARDDDDDWRPPAA